MTLTLLRYLFGYCLTPVFLPPFRETILFIIAEVLHTALVQLITFGRMTILIAANLTPNE